MIKSSGCRVCFARFLRYYSESARLDQLECNAGFDTLHTTRALERTINILTFQYAC